MNRSARAKALAIVMAAAACPLACTAATAAVEVPPTRAEIDRLVRRAHDEARVAMERAERDVAAARSDVLAGHDLLAQLDLDFDLPTLAFLGSEFGTPREIVKNAPYTADAVNETVQVLQDGNRIVKRSVTRLARDTVGRTRQEKAGARGTTVYLFDPIDDRNYALDPQNRIAVRIPRVPAPPIPPAPLSPMMAPVAPTPPTPPTPQTPATPPTPPAPPASLTPLGPPVTPPAASPVATPGRMPAAGAGAADRTPVAVTRDGNRVFVRRDGAGRAGDDVQVEIIRIAGDERAPLTGLPPIAMPLATEGKGLQKSLGTRDFDGVRADGTQTTHTIPAGAIGNEKPIVITRERWFSPELQLVVYVRNVDPRAGETTYRLTNLRRGEPPAELFRVPDDYRRRGDTRG